MGAEMSPAEKAATIGTMTNEEFGGYVMGISKP